MSVHTFGSNMTLSEMVRREAPNGVMADLVNVLTEENPIMLDAKVTECNNGTSHEATLVASEPGGEERGYNSGVSAEAAVTEKITEPTCMHEGISEIDDALLQHSPDRTAARMQEDSLYLSGMEKILARRLFNNDSGSTTVGDRATYPLRINGFPFRSDYNALSSSYVVDNAGGNASATANKMSIWLIQWGPKRVNLIFPRNAAIPNNQYGIEMKDHGLSLVEDEAGKKYPAWQTHFKRHYGLFVFDKRCVRRIVNIAASGIDGLNDVAFNEEKLIEAYMAMPHNQQGITIYCNSTVRTQMWKRLNAKSNVNFSPDKDPFGRPIIRFLDAPIRQLDALGVAEATIS